jgi:fatty acid desaturase
MFVFSLVYQVSNSVCSSLWFVAFSHMRVLDLLFLDDLIRFAVFSSAIVLYISVIVLALGVVFVVVVVVVVVVSVVVFVVVVVLVFCSCRRLL